MPEQLSPGSDQRQILEKLKEIEQTISGIESKVDLISAFILDSAEGTEFAGRHESGQRVLSRIGQLAKIIEKRKHEAESHDQAAKKPEL